MADDHELRHEDNGIYLCDSLNRLLNLLQCINYPQQADPRMQNDNGMHNNQNHSNNTVIPSGGVPQAQEGTGMAPPNSLQVNPAANIGAYGAPAENSYGTGGYNAAPLWGNLNIWPDGSPLALISGSPFFPGGHGMRGMQGYPSHNQHYNRYASYEEIPNTTDVEPVVGYGHEVVALAGPIMPPYVRRLRPRHPKTIDDHLMMITCGTSPFGPAYYLMLFDALLRRSCLINSGRLFRTSHEQVQGIGEINEMMGRLDIKKHPVAMMRRSEQAAPAKHQKIHVVEADEGVLINSSPSVGANKQQDRSCAWCGSSKHHGELINRRQFMVLDLKATFLGLEEKKSYSIDKPFEPEIVEFSSVLVDAATGDVKSDFHTYVRPIQHEQLGRFCMDYNGISQEDVEGEDAVILSEALQAHVGWLKDNGCVVETTQGELDCCVVVTTWGDWDCRTMLKQECHRKKLGIPNYLSRWMNLKKPFVETIPDYLALWEKKLLKTHDDIDRSGLTINKLMVQDAVAIAGLGWEGETQKGGRSHARNKARLLKRLIMKGAKLRITGWLAPGSAPSQPGSCRR